MNEINNNGKAQLKLLLNALCKNAEFHVKMCVEVKALDESSNSAYITD